MDRERTTFGRTKLLLRIICVCLGSAPVSAPLLALDPNQPSQQLYHTSWTAREGLDGGVNAIAQTPDGYLWIGTSDGLFRFDGLTFERYKPETGAFLTNSVSTLLAVPDGGLWIGYLNGGASFLRQGKVTNYSAYSGDSGFPVSTVRQFAQDWDGTIWAAVVGGFVRLEGERWQKIRMNWNYLGKAPTTVFVDNEGTLWVADNGIIMFLPKGAKKFHDTGIHTEGRIDAFAQLLDGTLCSLDDTHRLVSVLPQSPNRKTAGRPRKARSSDSMLVDQDGALWVVGQPEGLVRIPFPVGTATIDVGKAEPETQIITDKQGLTDLGSEAVLEDHEGNIWVGTDGGLDRFRHRNLTWRGLQSGTHMFSLVESDRGAIWAGTRSWYVQDTENGKRLNNSPQGTRTAYRDLRGTVWFGARDALWKWQRGTFSPVRPPDEVQKNSKLSKHRDPMIVSAITDDHAGNLWVSISGFGEFQLREGSWKFVAVVKDHPDWTARAAYTDSLDRVWLIYGEMVAVMDRGQVQTFSSREGLNVGLPNTISGRDDELWVGGENGIAFLQGNRFRALIGQDGTNFGLITGIVAPPNDGLWLAAGPGIVHIPEHEIQIVSQDPTHKVSYDVFDLVSDLPEQLQRGGVYSPGVIRGTDGILWFATRAGVARLDPARIDRNPLPPPVSIRSIVADGKFYSVLGRVSLPPLTRNLRIDYTALSLSIPERVRFRFKLAGHDLAWQDADARRSAFYTNLSPANYQFQVIASNNDGVWNMSGASVLFTITAAWYQTYWFKVICGLFLVSASYGLYRSRMRSYSRSLKIRFDERLSERTRLARDLHDTLLQTIQGSKLVADHAQSHTDDAVRTRRAIERLSEWLDRAMVEGRAALESLRNPATHSEDLVLALRRAAEAYLPESMTLDFSNEGASFSMHPVVCGEVIRIGEEAIRNACKHSGAQSLSIELRQDRNLTLLVRDDGCGFDSDLSDDSKRGHFGIVGMRERANQIGGRLWVDTLPKRGTCVKLTVPGKLIYKSPGRRFVSAIRKERRSKDHSQVH
jgi:signal transduction histidine kinase/ligand-binding sensor domain-containing protein